jgi:hypothetical protein
MKNLQKSLNNANGNINNSSATVLGYQVVRDIKHALSNAQHPSLAGKGSTDYELPDGTSIKVDGLYTSTCADVLFNPKDYGLDNGSSSTGGGGSGDNSNSSGGGGGGQGVGGIPQMIQKSIDSCDKDLAPDLWNNIVMAGGGTMIRGFGERVRTDLTTLTSKHKGSSSQRINVIPGESPGSEPGYNSQRKIGAWIGGSIFASLDTFGKVLVSKQEYEDAGSAAIVHRKAVI